MGVTFTSHHTGAPPRTRGWTWEMVHVCLGAKGSPAHAGMDPDHKNTCNTVSWLPRARGDGPVIDSRFPYIIAAPPRTRGWTLLRALRRIQAAGSPAHAGMDLFLDVSAARSPRLPRARGDGPDFAYFIGQRLLAPPRTRGWTQATYSDILQAEGSPAHAGMDPSTRPPSRPVVGLPRARGDGPGRLALVINGAKAPPRTRGWTR